MENVNIPEGKALLYVVRPEFMGKLIKIKVFSGEDLLGYTKGRNYFHTFLEPGKHNFISKAENKGKLDLEIEAGKTYYIKQKIGMGFLKVRNKLLQLEQKEAEREMTKCKPSSSMG